MKYVFHPEARAEFLAAIDYYEECEPGLGADFAIEVRSTIENILSFPNAWPILEDNIRRNQTRRFPYGIIYSQDEGVIFILAVMHLHRDPSYWQDRGR
jgi:toxin ParE1/3/4